VDTSFRKRTLTTPQFSSSSSFLLEARIAKGEEKHMVAWDRVTRRDVLRTIDEYDRLGPEQFFSQHGFAPTTTYELVWDNAVTRRRQSWAQLMSSPQGDNLALVTSRVGRPAP